MQAERGDEPPDGCQTDRKCGRGSNTGGETEKGAGKALLLFLTLQEKDHWNDFTLLVSLGGF